MKGNGGLGGDPGYQALSDAQPSMLRPRTACPVTRDQPAHEPHASPVLPALGTQDMASHSAHPAEATCKAHTAGGGTALLVGCGQLVRSGTFLTESLWLCLRGPVSLPAKKSSAQAPRGEAGMWPQPKARICRPPRSPRSPPPPPGASVSPGTGHNDSRGGGLWRGLRKGAAVTPSPHRDKHFRAAPPSSAFRTLPSALFADPTGVWGDLAEVLR